MNLKDAFRAQNKLQALMDEASCILQDQDNTLKVTTRAVICRGFLIWLLCGHGKIMARMQVHCR